MYFADVVVEIMSWLPPESLIRFKCVNKSWYALIKPLISDPIFVVKHLNNIKNNIFSPSCFIITELLLSVLAIFNDDHHEDNQMHPVIERLPPIPHEKDMRYATTYHSNGIICLVRESKDIMLWNPALMDVKFLPKPRLEYTWGTIGMGFGHDSIANDYKFVCIASHCRYRDYYVPLTAEVYCLHTNCWREIEMPMLHTNSIYIDAYSEKGLRSDMGIGMSCTNSIHRDVYCKGVFHWLLKDRDGIILSFNLSDEKFHSTPLPDNLRPTQECELSLMAWNDSVALVRYPFWRGDPLPIEIWIMNGISRGGEGGSSWIKYHIGPPLDIGFPLMFWENDELILEGAARGGPVLAFGCSFVKNY